MRVLLKVQLPVEAANAAIKNGSLPQTIDTFIKEHNPEAAYFFPENGKRTAMFVFDLSDSSRLPVISEPLFQNVNANLTMTPVMNYEDLQAGQRDVGSM